MMRLLIALAVTLVVTLLVAGAAGQITLPGLLPIPVTYFDNNVPTYLNWNSPARTLTWSATAPTARGLCARCRRPGRGCGAGE